MQQRAAAGVALAYVAVQSFQWYVFARLPETSDAVTSLLQGPHPLNIARAVTMLFSFVGLAYLFLVTCGILARRSPATAIAAGLGFLVFCVMELQLRSVELFHVFLALPSQYLTATTAAQQAQVLHDAAQFQAIQHALYFPLGLSWLLASALACIALRGSRWDWLARWAFGLNALRLLLRMLDVYVLGPHFDALYATLYLPLVWLGFVPLAIWLWRREPTPAAGARAAH
jgi:hypothetical protein